MKNILDKIAELPSGETIYACPPDPNNVHGTLLTTDELHTLRLRLKRMEDAFTKLRHDLTENTAYVTSGAIPVISGGTAAIRKTGVVSTDDISRAFDRAFESLKENQ